MIKKSPLYRQHVLFWFLLLIIFSQPLSAQSVRDVRASALYVQAPLLTEMTHNGAIRLRVHVPAGREVNYRGLQLTLDAATLKAIEKIDVLVREDGEAAFQPQAPVVASIKPAALQLNIPLQFQCRPGLNYLWISPVLKKDADPDQKLTLKLSGLVTANGQIQPLTHHLTSSGQPSNFRFRLGSAVRKAGEDNVHTYRIPGIVTTDKGTLIAVYDNRYTTTRDLPGNIDVGLSRSTDGGRTWEPMKVIMDMGAPHENNGIGDPAVLFDPVTKKIWVAALWSKGNRSIAGSMPGLSPDTTGQFVLVSSGDDGRTWSEPVSITAQVKNPAWHLFFNGPGSGIAMQDGKLVFAAQYWDEKKMPWSTIIYSNDQGKTWKGNLAGPKANTTEAQVVETTPGTLMLNMRDNRGSYRSVATTTDMGKTWTEHPTSYSALPDPVCMGSIIKARVNVKGKMRDVLFFSNPATRSGRYNMTIKASLDMGQTWLPANEVLVDERLGYGYSSLTKIDDNTIGILYEGTRDLYFVRVPVKDILN